MRAWTRTHLEAPDSSRPAGGDTMATSRFERSALFAGAALVLWMSVAFAQAPAPTSGVVAVDSTAEKAPTPVFTPPPQQAHIGEGSFFIGDDRTIRQVVDGESLPVNYGGCCGPTRHTRPISLTTE